MGILYQFSDRGLIYHHTLTPQPNPADFPMHAHEIHELYYFLSGRMNYIVEGNEYPLEKGSLLVIRAGEAHKALVRSGVYERAVVHFDGETLHTLDPTGVLERPILNRPLGVGNLYSRHTMHGSFVEECFRKMESSGTPEERRVVLLSNLYPILSEIYRVYSQGGGHPKSASPDGMQEVIAYINDHLSEELSLDFLSSRFYLSKPQLGRRFKQATGSSLWEYVLIKRLMQARRLIQNGERAMQAAQKSGFRDYSSFYRAYRGRYGDSPQADKGRGEGIG